MRLTQIGLALAFISLISGTIACSHTHPVVGSWEAPKAVIPSVFTFREDGTATIEVSPPKMPPYSYSGTYTRKDDSLSIRLTKIDSKNPMAERIFGKMVGKELHLGLEMPSEKEMRLTPNDDSTKGFYPTAISLARRS